MRWTRQDAWRRTLAHSDIAARRSLACDGRLESRQDLRQTMEDWMFDRLFGSANAGVATVSVEQAHARMTGQQPAPVLIDVREIGEFRQGHAKGAKNIPLTQLGQRLREIPKDREVLLICRSGSRSLQAAHFLQRQGWSQLANVSGGMLAWERHRLPVE